MIFKILLPTQTDEIEEGLSKDDLAILEAFKAQVLDTAKLEGKKNA